MAEDSLKKLTDNEKCLLDAVQKVNKDQVKTLLSESDVRVNCLDEHGMTAVQHACYKGDLEICELLISHGADVNSNYHEHGYSALMMAALSGKPDITKLVLEHGASKSHQNTVGRTASQMAAFVGQHNIVTLINNFFSREELVYYTQVHGEAEGEAKLPEELVTSLHTMLIMSNLNPVKICFYLKDNPSLLQNHKKVCNVLGLMCEKAMKSTTTNDIMAMKTHYMSCVLKEAASFPDIDDFIKSLLKGRAKDGFPEKQELFIRQSFRVFPYPDSELLRGMVMQCSKTTIGNDPTALSLLSSGINGQQFGDSSQWCDTCGERDTEKKKCTKCKMVLYCDVNCQKLHWPTHKKQCSKLAAQYKEQLDALKEKEAEERKKLEEATQTKLTKDDSATVKEPAENFNGQKEQSDEPKTDDASAGQSSTVGEDGTT